MSITQQKSDLREIIHRVIKRYLVEHPEEAHDIAMGAVRRLSKKMTLKELKEWHFSVCVMPNLKGAKKDRDDPLCDGKTN